MSLRTLLALAPLALFGCSSPGDEGSEKADSDADGLTNTDESSFGTDPLVADTDGDGLTDREEFDLGTDGTAMDSDEDTYNDGDEVTAGTDPSDAESRVYTGYWPYNPDKGSIQDPGWEGATAEAGTVLPNFAWKDQFGEDVDIYDYAGHGHYILVDLSGEWCGWCNVMAAWLDGDLSEAQVYVDEGYDWEYYNSGASWYDVIPEAVQDGDLYWVTALDSDWGGGAMNDREHQQWADAYPNEKIAVLSDSEQNLMTYMEVQGYPSVMLIAPDMTVEKYSARDYTKAISRAAEILTE
jgi:thiol-disulfide isomerase/thioredoxin